MVIVGVGSEETAPIMMSAFDMSQRLLPLPVKRTEVAEPVHVLVLELYVPPFAEIVAAQVPAEVNTICLISYPEGASNVSLLLG